MDPTLRKEPNYNGKQVKCAKCKNLTPAGDTWITKGGLNFLCQRCAR